MSLQKVFNDEIQLRFDEISNKLYNFKHSFDLFIKKLLGKCLGFAPRSESFAIEPSVQVCSISSLSEFRFAEMSCFATPASASSIRTQIRYAQLTTYVRKNKRWCITMGIFKIKADKFEWIGGAADDPQDLCLHGHVTVQFGDTTLEDTGTVSATALYLLKTLTEDKLMAEYDIQMIPCCGHTLIANDELTEVAISGCDTGTDWSTIHDGDAVRFILPTEQEEVVTLREYQYEVLDFAKSVKRFYDACTPKEIPEDEFDRNGYIAFWNEWQRRYNDGLMLLSLETGREMELSHDGLHYFVSHKDGEWSLYCEESKKMQLFPGWYALYENARFGDKLLRNEVANISFDDIL